MFDNQETKLLQGICVLDPCRSKVSQHEPYLGVLRVAGTPVPYIPIE
jgi:hypothetical protein